MKPSRNKSLSQIAALLYALLAVHCAVPFHSYAANDAQQLVRRGVEDFVFCSFAINLQEIDSIQAAEDCVQGNGWNLLTYRPSTVIEYRVKTASWVGSQHYCPLSGAHGRPDWANVCSTVQTDIALKQSEIRLTWLGRDNQLCNTRRWNRKSSDIAANIHNIFPRLNLESRWMIFTTDCDGLDKVFVGCQPANAKPIRAASDGFFCDSRSGKEAVNNPFYSPRQPPLLKHFADATGNRLVVWMLSCIGMRYGVDGHNNPYCSY